MVAGAQTTTGEAATALGFNLLDENSHCGPQTALVFGKIPQECCGYDRTSGEIVWGMGVAGTLIEPKRKIEREKIKEGLRVWLERKAREIRARKMAGGAGTSALVWRFSRKAKIEKESSDWREKPKTDKVTGLKRFFENLGS